MKRTGWLWFGGVQAVGICCSLIATPPLFQYFGAFLLLPGSLLPWLEGEVLKHPVSAGLVPQLTLLIVALGANALSWRSAARILND
jgi:hypothetical protein